MKKPRGIAGRRLMVHVEILTGAATWSVEHDPCRWRFDPRKNSIEENDQRDCVSQEKVRVDRYEYSNTFEKRRPTVIVKLNVYHLKHRTRNILINF